MIQELCFERAKAFGIKNRKRPQIDLIAGVYDKWIFCELDMLKFEAFLV